MVFWSEITQGRCLALPQFFSQSNVACASMARASAPRLCPTGKPLHAVILRNGRVWQEEYLASQQRFK